MTVHNTGLAVMTTLRNYGIDTIFGIPGTHNLELYRHLTKLDIRPVTTRHEQGAGYAADGWSQQTGLPGIVITTSGPGLLNALSAAATAYCESRPMIVISPGPARGEEFADRGTLHETKDTTGAAASVMVWSRRVSSAEEAVEAVHDAFKLFRTGRPRPVHIEIPLDILEAEVDVAPDLLVARLKPALALADLAAVQAAAAALGDARSPMILAGGGSLAADVGVRLLAETLRAPVVTTMNGKGALREAHPLSLGSNIRLPAAQTACSEADVLVVIGSKVGDAELWGGTITPTGTVIRIDILETQMNTNISADIRLVGHSRAVLEQLTQALAGVSLREERRPDIAQLRSLLRDQAHDHSPSLTALAEAIGAALPRDVILSGDSSQICYFGTSSLPVEQPHSFLYMAAYATLGYGLPAAIGAKIAAPERPVVAVLGDGALMFSIQELATAVEQNLDLVIVCADNGGYGEIKQNEADRGIPPVGVTLHQPDWPALARAFGGDGIRVTSREDTTSAVASALNVGGIQLVHVPLSLFDD